MTSLQLEVSCGPSIIALGNLYCFSVPLCTVVVFLEPASEVGCSIQHPAHGQTDSMHCRRSSRHGLLLHSAFPSTHCNPGCIPGQLKQQSCSILLPMDSTETFNGPQCCSCCSISRDCARFLVRTYHCSWLCNTSRSLGCGHTQPTQELWYQH